MKLSILHEKTMGIHTHTTENVMVWAVTVCPFCACHPNVVKKHGSQFLGGCEATLDFIKTWVFQCRANRGHVGLYKGGEIEMYSLYPQPGEPITLVPLSMSQDDKFRKDVMTYKKKMGGSYMMHPVADKWEYTPEHKPLKVKFPYPSKDADDALALAAASMKIQLPLPVNKIAVTMTVKPPEPVLKSPLSKWGQAMREKLDGLKKGS